MKTIKGPAIFLAQFVRDEAPYNSIEGLAKWASQKGFLGVQLPTHDRRIIDLNLAADSQAYADEYVGRLRDEGLELTELSSHLQGHLVSLHPAYDHLGDAFAPMEVRGNPSGRQRWAVEQLKLCARASRRLGLDRHVTFSGSLLWPHLYPYPQWPHGLIEDGFAEQARRWHPLLDYFDEWGVDVCFEIHPAEDLHDGLTFEMFLDKVQGHTRCNLMYDPSHLLLQGIDYSEFIDHYHSRIKMFHVKDAEFRPTGKTGAYGGFQPWVNRAGRFRSLGDGQIDFKDIFSRLTACGYDGWAVLEWECCLKNSEDGASEGARFIRDHIISVSDLPFDSFVKADFDREINAKILGLNRPEIQAEIDIV